jgi:hypothetical protein
VDRIPDDSRRAIWKYSGPNSPVNPALRDGSFASDPDVAKIVAGVDAAFAAVPPTTQDIVVTRGLRRVGRFLPPDATGFQYVERGYLSTSTDVDVATSFIGTKAPEAMILDIVVPAGSKVLPVEAIGTQFPGQHEVLLPRGNRVEFTTDVPRTDASGRTVRYASARVIPGP